MKVIRVFFEKSQSLFSHMFSRGKIFTLDHHQKVWSVMRSQRRVELFVLFFYCLIVYVEADCFPDYTNVFGNCYKIYTSNANFTTAKSTCEEDGGYLVSVTANLEKVRLASPFGSYQDYWIGLKRLMGAGAG